MAKAISGMSSGPPCTVPSLGGGTPRANGYRAPLLELGRKAGLLELELSHLMLWLADEALSLVPRTRSSHSRAASSIANFGFKGALES
jgi:hypothetical protein